MFLLLFGVCFSSRARSITLYSLNISLSLIYNTNRVTISAAPFQPPHFSRTEHLCDHQHLVRRYSLVVVAILGTISFTWRNSTK